MPLIKKWAKFSWLFGYMSLHTWTKEGLKKMGQVFQQGPFGYRLLCKYETKTIEDLLDSSVATASVFRHRPSDLISKENKVTGRIPYNHNNFYVYPVFCQ